MTRNRRSDAVALLRACAVAACALAAGACSRSATRVEPDLVVTAGTYFGFCAGYCNTELVVGSTTVRLVETARDSAAYPPRSRTMSITRTEWERIRALADPAILARVRGVHGCPDCADGGGEWVQVSAAGDTIRATFEYGRTLDEIAGLQAEIRAIRDRFEAMPRS